MQECKKKHLRVDFMCVHWYNWGGWNTRHDKGDLPGDASNDPELVSQRVLNNFINQLTANTQQIQSSNCYYRI